MAFVHSAFLSIAAFLAAGGPKEEVPFAPLDAAFGHDSSITQGQATIAQDQAGWNSLWAGHRGTSGANLPGTIKLADDRPPVDFKKNFVVGIFGGTTQGIEGYRIVETAIEGGIAYIRFRPIPPTVPQGIPPLTQPYGFVILPRTKAKIQVQLPKGPDQWQTVAKFEPTLTEKKK